MLEQGAPACRPDVDKQQMVESSVVSLNSEIQTNTHSLEDWQNDAVLDLILVTAP